MTRITDYPHRPVSSSVLTGFMLSSCPRMAQKCGAIVEQVGEDDLYKEYRKRKTLFRYLCKEVSKDCKDKKDEL